MKYCNKCSQFKDLADFYNDSTHTDGKQSSCKFCVTYRIKDYYSRNSQKVKDYQKNYYQKNKKLVLERNKQWRLKNPELYKKIRCVIEARRRARIKAGYGEHYSRQEVYDKFGGFCIVCDKRINLDLKFPDRKAFTIHHLLPLSKGGDDSKRNLTPAHFRCNQKVGDKIPIAAIPKVYYG